MKAQGCTAHADERRPTERRGSPAGPATAAALRGPLLSVATLNSTWPQAEEIVESARLARAQLRLLDALRAQLQRQAVAPSGGASCLGTGDSRGEITAEEQRATALRISAAPGGDEAGNELHPAVVHAAEQLQSDHTPPPPWKLCWTGCSATHWPAQPLPPLTPPCSSVLKLVRPACTFLVRPGAAVKPRGFKPVGGCCAPP
ncbi:hypothetical protein HaLaN_31650 [Haematococcus lacustris]|uniref:Uncharacterized protein n=1 Tax=Haematococcus lacustris TaxID=44745 RepID=A0A6A0AI70_HAELA|nr:hypothetical protein HaLaN_31650 [Haematococcus lacustris]